MIRPALELVAHRGDAAHFPENSLSGLTSALRASVPWVEIDLQLTADRVPVVLHDASLARTAGQDVDIRELPLEVARRFAVGEPARFGSRYAGEPLATLDEFVTLLGRWPRARAMVEIKRESAEHFGVEAMVGVVLAALAPVRERVTLISFVEQAVEAAARAGWPATGWCLNEMDAWHRDTARRLAPTVLLFDHARVPEEGLWAGPWDWALWEITDPGLARQWHARGARYIESMDSVALLEALRGTRGQE